MTRLLATCLCLTSTTCFAATNTPTSDAAKDSEPQVRERIEVTARKRTELLSDVPQPVSVVDKQALQDNQINLTSDLAKALPSLGFAQSFNARLEGFSIRGITTIQYGDAVEQSVGVVRDGVPLIKSAPGASLLLDTERVELLKGPQGILYGKNASAGLISIISRAPEVGSNYAQGFVRYASGSDNQQQAVLNIGASEPFALRAAYGRLQSDSTVRNVATQQSLNDGQDQAARVRLRFTPLPSTDIDVTVDGSRKRTDCCAWTIRAAPATTTMGTQLQRVGITPGASNDAIAAGGDFFQNADSQGLSAQITHRLLSSKIVALSNIQRWEQQDTNDSDLVPINVLDRNFTDTSQRSQFHELRWQSDTDSQRQFSWLIGANSNESKQNTISELQGGFSLPLAPGATVGSRLATITRNTNRAVFGQLSLPLSESIRVLADVRWNSDATRLNAEQTKISGSIELVPGRLAGNVSDAISERKGSWRITADYRANASALFYATTANGYKGPGLSVGQSLSLNIERVDSELPQTNELGARLQWLSGAAGLNVALFQSRFKRFQTTVFDQTVTPGRFRLTNAARLDTEGIELEGRLVPVRSLALTASVTYLDAKFGELKNIGCWSGQPASPFGTVRTSPRDCIRTGASLTSPSVTEGTGNPLPYSSRVSVSANARWQTNVAGGTAIAHLGYRWRSKVSYSTPGDPNMVQGAIGTFNGSVTWRPMNDRWSVTLYGTNLANRKFTGPILLQPALAAQGVYAQFLTPEAERRVGLTFAAKLGL